MRVLLWLPLAALVLFGAIQAFRAGWIVAHLSESAAIETYAARYMQETGAPAADCTAVPGEKVWLVIRCGTGEDRRIYRVNRFGGLVTGDPEETIRMEEPST
ncbi:hypothetical protein [Mameliella sediminis]|uniref:hypothetical protein n=1 Tax=Mameliella sediminis TaxID=2836866 RepID=UPI001C48DB1A|nr:hypothetical protein [Mameliella sediminis]MBY6115490.1 hypothetical protein [Antarctobacter heliothermus]MBY6145737.1 hypothetical protein [Mameliella alba]MBV7393540.1 hypothetical protein [Mameliella sediminis]MBY6161060.1 hypothetical protein [Mameliella alba]MBY6169530.1 hypothetical protein [Mameliella alba]